MKALETSLQPWDTVPDLGEESVVSSFHGPSNRWVDNHWILQLRLCKHLPETVL